MLNQVILGTNFAYFTRAEQQSDMDEAKCELPYPFLLLPSTSASQSCEHIVGHLMHLIHFTNKAAVMPLDYDFSLGLGVCLQGLSPDHTHRSCLYSCSAAIFEGTMDRVGIYVLRAHLVMLQLQKAICPWEQRQSKALLLQTSSPQDWLLHFTALLLSTELH